MRYCGCQLVVHDDSPIFASTCTISLIITTQQR